MAVSDTALAPSKRVVQRSWDTEDLYLNSDAYFETLLTAIDKAHHSVFLVTYIFNFDSLGRRFIRHLQRACQRGVDVKVLFDGVGSMETGAKVAQALEETGIPVKVFHPLPWQPENFRRSLQRSLRLNRYIVSVLKLNQRQHAKICLIDQRELFCGSQNISADHLNGESGGKGWHDFGARVSGGAVSDVAEMFENLWEFRKPRTGRGLFKYYWSTLSTLARLKKNKLLVKKLAEAEYRIWLINSYFSPTRSIVKAIIQAAKNGADVRIIVPSKSDIQFFPLLTATYYDELIKHGVRIFEFLPAILHAKAVLADDFFLIGSTNFNHRSILHDVEFDIVLEQPDSLRWIEGQFMTDQSQCREIHPRDLELFGKRRLLGWIPWLVRYWL